MKKFFTYLIFAVSVGFLVNLNLVSEASFMDVLDTINTTSRTINSVNRAAKGTMSTVEYSQRFTDRQQDRKDRKRAEKDYNSNAEAEYYRTLQETQQLNQQYNGSNL